MEDNNKRIAKNTLVLYVRMVFMMAVALYTSRINLESLGIVDYGVYNAVGGMVAMFSILSGSLSVAIGRYLTYELGTGNRERLNTIFCTAVNIQLLVSFAIVLIAEGLGVWFLNTYMNVPAERMVAAHWVLQCSILTFVFGLISVPYNALIVAHERMQVFAYLSIIDAVMKLLICYYLYISPVDKLIVFAVLLAVVSLIMRCIYAAYCKRHFAEARYHLLFDRPLLREMSRFIGWAFFGNGVVVLKDQGSNILLNIYCGPAVNAARGVAMQVNAAVGQLVSNFLMAVNPQITKSYSSGDLDAMHKLIIRSGKFGFFIMLFAFFPICANIHYILGLWLVEVPAHTANFVFLILIYTLTDCFGQPLINGVLAEGNIKSYEIHLTVLYLSMFFASWACLARGFAPEWVFIWNVVFKVLVIGALLWHSRGHYAFPLRMFFVRAVLPSAAVFLLCAFGVGGLSLLPWGGLQKLVFSTLLLLPLTAAVIYAVGLTRGEAAFLREQINRRLRRKTV